MPSKLLLHLVMKFKILEEGSKNNTILYNHKENLLTLWIQWNMLLNDATSWLNFQSANVHKGFIGAKVTIYSLIIFLISIPWPITMTTHTDINQETWKLHFHMSFVRHFIWWLKLQNFLGWNTRGSQFQN